MIITLLTDLGTKDATVAAVKATLWKHVPGATVVDVSHHVLPHNWREAAYLLASVYSSFPPGTTHLAMAGIFIERPVAMILAEREGHYFIAPDNGLLPIAFSAETLDAGLCNRYEKPYRFMSWVEDAGSILRTLAEQGTLSTKGHEASVPPPLPPPLVTPVSAACRVLYADRYNNMVVNITRPQFESILNNRPFRIRSFRGDGIATVSKHYNDVPEGEPLCRFNKTGYLEIAVNHGSALELFGLEPGDKDALDYHMVRIYFS
jgi:S-adenosylmethionine hydrolase